MLFIVAEKNSGFRYMAITLVLMAMLSIIPCAAIDDNDGYNSYLRRKRRDMQLYEGNACRTWAGELGICKSITSCGEYIHGLRSKTIKYSFMFRCGFTEVVCCPIRNISTNLWTENPTNRTVHTNNGRPIHKTELITPRVPLLVHQNERPSQAACREWKSLNPALITHHILGGIPAAQGEYPHMGALIIPTKAGGYEVLCGSSLIAHQYVLTAAHCLSEKDRKPTIVRFGMVDLNSDEYDDYEIEDYITHPNFHSKYKYHDIGIVKLNQSVVFTIYTRPACLFHDTTDVDVAKELVVSGWGITDAHTRTEAECLLLGNLTTVPLSKCKSAYGRLEVGRSLSRGIQEGQYCAHDDELKSDACHADSGGPLQLVENKESTIVGIISFGLSCGSRTPSVFTRVGYYLDWIETIVWPS